MKTRIAPRIALCAAVAAAMSLATGALAGAPPHRTPQEEANLKLAIAFYNAGLNEKNWEKVLTMIGPKYIQHNPGAPDGHEGFKAHIENLKKNAPLNHGEIKHAYVDGDRVILHLHTKRRPEDRGMSIVDMFRIENGKVVEHWDVVQQVPETAQNTNTMW